MPNINSLKFKLTVALLFLVVSLACTKHNKPAVKRYPFTGRIVSVDKAKQEAMIDGDTIPGFMEPMEMSYKVKNASDFTTLAAGDSITAEVVVVETADKDAVPDYWLEKVKVTGHPKLLPM